MENVSLQSYKENSNLRILYRICVNTTRLSVYIDRHNCYNKEAVSVGTRLNFCYIYDSFCPFMFLFLLIAGGILRRYMSIGILQYHLIFTLYATFNKDFCVYYKHTTSSGVNSALFIYANILKAMAIGHFS
jgi:hypothetical protein